MRYKTCNILSVNKRIYIYINNDTGKVAGKNVGVSKVYV